MVGGQRGGSLQALVSGGRGPCPGDSMLALTVGLAGVPDTHGTGGVDSRTQGCPKVSLEAAQGRAGGEDCGKGPEDPDPPHTVCASSTHWSLGPARPHGLGS